MIYAPTPRARVVHQVLASLIVIPFAAPLVSVLAVSLTGEGLVTNYRAVLTETPIIRFAVNSLIISAGTLAVVITATLLAGFAFSKLRFKGRELLFNSVLVGLVLPPVTLLVPVLIGVQKFDLFNNFLSVIVPVSAVLLPFTILLVKTFIDKIPDELLEAAEMDGASDFTILVRIIVPLSRSIIAVVVILTFLNAWNEFLFPLVFLQDERLQAVTQIPTYFSSSYGSDTPKIFAAIIVSMIPIIALYLALQRQFERGLTGGAIK